MLKLYCFSAKTTSEIYSLIYGSLHKSFSYYSKKCSNLDKYATKNLGASCSVTTRKRNRNKQTESTLTLILYFTNGSY